MCIWCERAAPSPDGYTIDARRDARLAGWRWSGSHADAVSGGLAAMLERLRGRVVEEQAFAPGPVVVLTLPGPGDRIACFCGAGLADGAAAPAGLEELAVPAGDYARVHHNRSQGDAIDRYADLLGWMRAERLARDTSRWQHREEYPLHANFARPEVVRLMVPVALGH
jgi:predicted transcriptional regulator YdeE